MKKIEWVIAFSLVFIGLSCLTMSANWILNPDSIRSYLATLLRICLWAGGPVLLAGLIYLFIRRKEGDS
jgi:hypothetical protein